MANRSSKPGAIKTNGTAARNQRPARNHRPADDRTIRRAFDRRRRTRPLIAVFGSSRPSRGDELFRDGLELGRLLGAGGFDVMTGGYTGVMEAVSQGAHDAGARVLGVTMKGFEDRTNPYVMDEIRTSHFYQRFRYLVDGADGWVVMRGGMGTLAEMTFAWQKLWLKMLTARPLILVGLQWRKVLDVWLENMTVLPDDYRGLTVAATPSQACEALRAFFARETGAARRLDSHRDAR
jgi:uncharacterized protein (TIGR00730 family)